METLSKRSSQKRWNVETFYKTLKSHAALAKSPTKRERTRFVEPSGETNNYCFMAIYAACLFGFDMPSMSYKS